MLTGGLKTQIDRIWDAFWSGGISNPLEVIEQITYLLFLRRLDDLHTLEENKSARLKERMARRVFPEGNDSRGRPYEDLRWSRLIPAALADIIGKKIAIAGDGVPGLHLCSGCSEIAVTDAIACQQGQFTFSVGHVAGGGG